MVFRELTGDDHLPVSQRRLQVFQGPEQAMGRLETNKGSSLFSKAFQEALLGPGFSRQESLIYECIAWEPRGAEGGEDRRDAWNGDHRNLSGQGTRDEVVSRI